MTALEEYRSCLARLETLWNIGQGESQAADDLRDHMDTVWKRLSPEEFDQLHKPRP